MYSIPEHQNILNKYLIFTDLKGKIVSVAAIIGDFNPPLKAIDRSHSLNKKTLASADIYRTFHPQTYNTYSS